MRSQKTLTEDYLRRITCTNHRLGAARSSLKGVLGSYAEGTGALVAFRAKFSPASKLIVDRGEPTLTKYNRAPDKVHRKAVERDICSTRPRERFTLHIWPGSNLPDGS